MLGSKLNHVSKRGYWCQAVEVYIDNLDNAIVKAIKLRTYKTGLIEYDIILV